MENGHQRAWSPWYLLLLIQFIPSLWVPFYNSVEPTFVGMPFFYWFQLALVLVSAGNVPAEVEPGRREVFTTALRELASRAEHRGVRLALETGCGPPGALKSFLETINLPGLAASIDPAACLQAGVDPVASVRELAAWIVHAYATDAVRAAGSAPPNPRGHGFPPGALYWEEYLGALE